MFSVTYLGHQGWSIRGTRGHVLVDPLLTDEYSPGFSAEIHPPRRFLRRRFPPVDAVILSHEHADHVNLPSLALLDRQVPIVLPARSARAIRDAIAALGFRVVPSRAGDRFIVGDLDVRLLGGAVPGLQLDGEVTNLQILIADRARHGSFFSYVDGWPTADTLATIRREVGRLGVLCHANNAMDWSCLEAGPGGVGAPSEPQIATELLAAEIRWWGDAPPAVSAICGPGLAFRGDDAWMNQILCVDSDRLCAALHAALPDRTFRAPLPGETIELVAGRLHRIAPRAAFVRASVDRSGGGAPRSRRQRGAAADVSRPSLAARSALPSRTTPRRQGANLPRSDVAARSALPSHTMPRRTWLEEYPPACGERSLDEAAWPTVLAELDQLAAFLYRRELFHGVLALDGAALGRRKPAFALVLRCDRDDLAHVFEYLPDANRFARVRATRPLETYALGLECWVPDLWRVLVGRMLPQRLLGHLRTWSFSPAPLSPLFAIWGFFDALHRPAAAAAFYGPLVERLRDRPSVIAAGRHARELRVQPRPTRSRR